MSIKQNILNLVESSFTSWVLDAETDFDPSPYDSALSQIIVVQAEGPVQVSVNAGRQIQVEGSKQNLEAFSSFFDFPPNAESGRHSHYEYYEGNEWIAAESVPIVVSVR
jgi:hypothetical protein